MLTTVLIYAKRFFFTSFFQMNAKKIIQKRDALFLYRFFFSLQFFSDCAADDDKSSTVDHHWNAKNIKAKNKNRFERRCVNKLTRSRVGHYEKIVLWKPPWHADTRDLYKLQNSLYGGDTPKRLWDDICDFNCVKTDTTPI